MESGSALPGRFPIVLNSGLAGELSIKLRFSAKQLVMAALMRVVSFNGGSAYPFTSRTLKS